MPLDAIVGQPRATEALDLGVGVRHQEYHIYAAGLTGTPLRQDVAVTGSINQAGQVQAIGAVNEKVEGFFDVCRAAGLTGSQGVCFPRSNVKNLVLRRDVVQAVEHGKFHLWGIDHVGLAIELFSGIPAGNVDQPETFRGHVQARLTDMLESLKKQPPGQQVYVTPSAAPAAPPPDPRPPLPGRDGAT